jgi:hypothetical protein
VKDLKSALEAPFKYKDAPTIQIEPIVTDPLARERELMQAAIDEVLEGGFTEEISLRETNSNPQLVIQNFMADLLNGRAPEVLEEANQPKTKDFVVSHNELGTSISLQRHDMASRYLEPSIFDYQLREDPQNFGEAFGEASLDELAQLGMFEGQHGRKIFDNIVDRDQSEIRRTDELPLDETPKLLEIPMLNTLPDIENPLEPVDITPQIDNLQPVIAEQTNNDNDNINNNIVEVEQPAIPAPQTPRQVNSDQSYADRMARLGKTPSINEQEQTSQQNEQKPKRKPRARRIKKILGNEPVVNFIKPLSIKPKKPLKIRKEPNRVESAAKNLDVYMWSLLEDLLDYIVPQASDVEEIINMSKAVEPMEIPQLEQPSIVQPEILQLEQQLIQPEVPMEIPQLEQDTPMEIPPLELLENSIHKRAITSPELQMENVSKRPRLEKPAELETSIMEIPQLEPSIEKSHPEIIPEIPQIEINEVMPVQQTLPEIVIQKEKSAQNSTNDFDPKIDMIQRQASLTGNLSIINIPEMLNPSTASPSAAESLFKTPLLAPAKTQPSASMRISIYNKIRESTGLKKIDGCVTGQDIAFAQMVNRSKELAYSEKTLPPLPSFFNQETSNAPPEGYREFKKKGVECIQFKNKQGKIVQYEEYNIQNMLLYLQVRKYMKDNKTSKINVQKILQDKILKIKHVTNNHVMMVRLWRLCERGFFKGEYSDNDTQLLEIELPHEVTHTENKENIP